MGGAILQPQQLLGARANRMVGGAHHVHDSSRSHVWPLCELEMAMIIIVHKFYQTHAWGIIILEYPNDSTHHHQCRDIFLEDEQVVNEK